MRVLIADDSEAFVKRLLSALAEIRGAEVIAQARTGTEALQAVRSLHPEIIILDISMPEGTGIEVLEGMKAEKAAPVTIVLTNFTYSQYRKRCQQLGAVYFFDKSTEFAKVGEVLRRLIQGESEAPEGGYKMAERESPPA